jgi:hypothetical protein
MEGLALVVWSSWRSFCTVVGVDSLPEAAQLGALEWMASDDLELWDYESISVERLEATICTSGLHKQDVWNTRGGWGYSFRCSSTRMLLARVYYGPRQCRSSSLRLDTFVGTLQGSIPSDIFRLSTLGTCSRGLCDLLSIERRISPLFSDLAEVVSLVNNMLTGDNPGRTGTLEPV